MATATRQRDGETTRFRHPALFPVALLGLGLAGLAYLWGHNPHDTTQWMIPCPFNLMTGLNCPSCGATRMTYDLLHGNWLAAWRDNAALLLVTPLALTAYGKWLWEGIRGRTWRLRLPKAAVIAILVVTALWGVGRNLVGW